MDSLNFTSKSLKKLIKNCDGVKSKISQSVSGILKNNPYTLVKVPEISVYLNSEERKIASERIIEKPILEWICYTSKLQNHLSDEQLREKILNEYQKTPWNCQIQAENISGLFSNDFFKNIVEKQGNLDDRKLFEIFLLFNSHKEINSFSGKIRDILDEKTKNSETIIADLHGYKSPGFACGGMEKNFYTALNEGKGICLINDFLLAKFFHRKGEAKKVSFLPTQTLKTENGYILWENYFYAPQDGQHKTIIEAIEEGETELKIQDLALKSIRPSNGLVSEKALEKFEKNFSKKIPK